MAYTLCAAFNTGTAGQTLSAQVVDTAGTNVGSAGVGTFLDLGLGFYGWFYNAMPAGHRGYVKITSSGTLVAVIAINPEEFEYVDAAMSSRLAPGGSVTYAGPVAENNDVELVRGDDYDHDESRALPWSTTDSSTWPTLTGASLTFTVKKHDGTTVISKTNGTVVTATGANKAIRQELAAADTSSLSPGSYVYDVQATLSGTSRKVTLVRGTLRLLEDYSS